MSLKTQRAGFRVVLIQLPSDVAKALIPDSLPPSCKVGTLAVQDCILPHHSQKERENVSLNHGSKILGFLLMKMNLVMCYHALNQWL